MLWSTILPTAHYSYRISEIGWWTLCLVKVASLSLIINTWGRTFSLWNFMMPHTKMMCLISPPSFFGRKFMYTFPWVPNFDVTMGNYNFLPDWVGFPYRSIALESACFKLSSSVGEVLLFIKATNIVYFQMTRLVFFGTLLSRSQGAFRWDFWRLTI